MPEEKKTKIKRITKKIIRNIRKQKKVSSIIINNASRMYYFSLSISDLVSSLELPSDSLFSKSSSI